MPRILKTQVSPGIFWVEIPEVHLYILCACPADSIKHLMKRGLIVTREKNGVAYENGPNAILLSDLLVQNGNFSNLAEFPILQMLYRQGMILPNHPKNTGVKPLVMGSARQVRAQMEYIYRGNYGLISEEEIVEAGVAPDEAREMMRLKFKFAFGKIKYTDELIDSIIIGQEKVEIRDGVFIRRLRLNVFEISYGEESVTVDLNLKPQEKYPAPYPLGIHNIKREYFAVIHSGEGDGWDPNRPCMSSILMFQGKIFLIDAGPNLMHSLISLGIGVNEIDGIFQTHAHDDHFSGLTTLLRSDHRIKYYATKLVRISVMKKLAALLSIEPEEFFNYFDIEDLKVQEWNDIEGLEVKPIYSPHPLETNIYVFRTLCEDGYRTYGHFADIVGMDILRNMITDNDDEPGVTNYYYDEVLRDYTQKLDLKKIDIGGGLIHGNAEDFSTDASGKILLSHTDAELSHRQKEIGSGAPFGMVDVLIPAVQDYIRRDAFHFLQGYFPSVPRHQFSILMNCPLVTFNPETIIIRGGETTEDIYLVLTGDVEMINTESNVYNMLSAGAFIGERAGLTGTASNETFRAVNFVQALQIKSGLYLQFIKKNNLYASIERLQDRLALMQRTWLFGEAISQPIQSRIARQMQASHYEPGQEIKIANQGDLILISDGSIEVSDGPGAVSTLNSGEFFGEECALFGQSSPCEGQTTRGAEIYSIPGHILMDIPIVRWKLYETHAKKNR